LECTRVGHRGQEETSMNRQKLLVAAIVPVLAALTLSACNKSEPANAQGGLVTAPATTEQSGTIPNAEPSAVPTTPVEPMAQAPAAPAGPVVAYADVTNVKPVTVKETQYGTVTKSVEITQNSTTPREVCQDVTVQERLPERDGNAGGTVAGAVIGGVLGNQVGKGNGRKAATVAGAVAGGLIGNKIDKSKDNGKLVSRTEQQCHTEDQNVSNVVGYTVTYKKPGGGYGTKRMDDRPANGSRIALGSAQKTVGYDVTYTYEGRKDTVRMDRKPGDQLTVVDGKVVTQSAPVNNG
jgi:uncharacterized protein YcfJ